MNIGLFLENGHIKDVDLRFPELGNPGIGGTHYNFLTLSYHLEKRYASKINLTLYATDIKLLPSHLDTVKVSSLSSLCKIAQEQACDILIWRPNNHEDDFSFLKEIGETSIKLIAWAHNTPSVAMLDALSTCDQVVRYIAVGKEQLDMVRDHPIIYKGDVISNGFDALLFKPKEKVSKDRFSVAYLGSLIPAKGFHVLAEVWPEVLREFPEAKLSVIGSGKLYNRDTEMGKWGIAEESYEKTWRSYLEDQNGAIHPSVRFLGLLGAEKVGVLQQTQVGVVNPTGISENCPGSALEFQAAGTPVVSVAEWGMLDTVLHERTGFLGKGKKGFLKRLKQLLGDTYRANDMGTEGIAFIEKYFSHDLVCEKWFQLFSDIQRGQMARIRVVDQNPLYNFKFLVELLRRVKRNIPLARKLPPFFVWKKILKGIKFE